MGNTTHLYDIGIIKWTIIINRTDAVKAGGALLFTVLTLYVLYPIQRLIAGWFCLRFIYVIPNPVINHISGHFK